MPIFSITFNFDESAINYPSSIMPPLFNTLTAFLFVFPASKCKIEVQLQVLIAYSIYYHTKIPIIIA